MQWFCKHEWSVIKQTYAKPGGLVVRKITVQSSKDMDKVLYGVTSLYEKCIKCSKTRITEMLGKTEEENEE